MSIDNLDKLEEELKSVKISSQRYDRLPRLAALTLIEFIRELRRFNSCTTKCLDDIVEKLGVIGNVQ
jgi:hypothetical protein